MIDLYDENKFIFNLTELYKDPAFVYENGLDLPITIYMDYSVYFHIEDTTDDDDVSEYFDAKEGGWDTDLLEKGLNKVKDQIISMCAEITKQSNGQFELKYSFEENDVCFDTDCFIVCFYVTSNQPITEPTILDMNPILKVIADMPTEEVYDRWSEDCADPDHIDVHDFTMDGCIEQIIPGDYQLG